MTTRCIILFGVATGILLNMAIHWAVEPVLLLLVAVLAIAGGIEYRLSRRRASR